MTTITPDDIRVLARAEEPEAVLAIVAGQAVVAAPDQVPVGTVIYSRASLVAEYGEEITDLEAELLAAGLTAQASPT